MGGTSVGSDDGEVPAQSQHRPPATLRGGAPDWASVLRGPPTSARDAVTRHHSLLLRATRFELARRRDQLKDVGPAALDDLACQAADDALMTILDKLEEFPWNESLHHVGPVRAAGGSP